MCYVRSVYTIYMQLMRGMCRTIQRLSCIFKTRHDGTIMRIFNVTGCWVGALYCSYIIYISSMKPACQPAFLCVCFMRMMILWYNNCVQLYNLNQFRNFPHCDEKSFDVSKGAGGGETVQGCCMFSYTVLDWYIFHFHLHLRRKVFWKILFLIRKPVNNSIKTSLLT